MHLSSASVFFHVLCARARALHLASQLKIDEVEETESTASNTIYRLGKTRPHLSSPSRNSFAGKSGRDGEGKGDGRGKGRPNIDFATRLSFGCRDLETHPQERGAFGPEIAQTRNGKRTRMHACIACDGGASKG